MAVSKFVILTVMLAVFISTVTAQFGLGFGDLGFGFGGKPFGKPGFGGLGGGKPGFGGLGGGKPGKPGSLWGGLGGLDLYRYQRPGDGVVYYNWQNAPTHN